MMTGSYKDLMVWQKAMELTEVIYRVTKRFPREEQYGLVSQMRRCAVSIPSNIAEGKMRGYDREFRKYLRVAYASAAELETQLIISYRANFLSEIEYNEAISLLTQILKMLNRFIDQAVTRAKG